VRHRSRLRKLFLESFAVAAGQRHVMVLGHAAQVRAAGDHRIATSGWGANESRREP
jgi:hypothetical protein